MVGGSPSRTGSLRAACLAGIAVVLGMLAPLALAEVVLRFLPVDGGLVAAAVNERNPVFHFTPNRRLTWSRGWDFALVNRIRVNNAGYVNDQDYAAADARPLCAIVGDSYVEAAMVPYAETVQGRLARAFAPDARVYSLAASGAPLSQYVVWAREARERWRARALAIVVIGNDFDESLAAYKVWPGFHHYVEAPDGPLTLQRYDYEPTWRRELVLMSALGRYLVFNLQVQERLRALLGARPALVVPAHAQEYVGNVRARVDKAKVDRSKAATRAFLRDIVELAGWTPDKVVFVLDGIRYPSDSPTVSGSYFVQMRSDFIAQARAAGFEAVDLDTHFLPRFQAEGKRFEFPTDNHWNALGHGVAADALRASRVFSNCGLGVTAAAR